MNLLRRPPRLWIWVGLAAVVVGIGWFAGEQLATGTPSRPEDRDWVRGKLAEGGDFPVALPVKLPRGYRAPRIYGLTTAPDNQVLGRNIFFGTTPSGRASGLHTVVLCVQRSEPPDNGGCQAPNSKKDPPGSGTTDADYPRPMIRHTGELLVMLNFKDQTTDDRAAWQTTDYTADLDNVSWLH